MGVCNVSKTGKNKILSHVISLLNYSTGVIGVGKGVYSRNFSFCGSLVVSIIARMDRCVIVDHYKTRQIA